MREPTQNKATPSGDAGPSEDRDNARGAGPCVRRSAAPVPPDRSRRPHVLPAGKTRVRIQFAEQSPGPENLEMARRLFARWVARGLEHDNGSCPLTLVRVSDAPGERT